MRNECRQLRRVVTAYIDNEASERERLAVEDHLERCSACRDRASREGAVRQLIRSRSAEARAQGAPLAWPAGRGTRNHRGGGTLLRVAAVSAAVVAVVFVMGGRWRVEPGVPLAARGLIGDSRCAGGHAHEGAEFTNMSDRECVKRCVDTGARYVFVSQGVVYPIRNQDFGGLARFAGQDVQIEGEVRQHLLTVSEVHPLTVLRLPESEPRRPCGSSCNDTTGSAS